MNFSENNIDITHLPEIARREIIDFWEYLTLKYSFRQTEQNVNGAVFDTKELLESLNNISLKIVNPSIDDPSAWQKEIREDRLFIEREA